MKRWIKGGVRALTLGLMMSTSALAAPLSGKVFLDYDNTQTNTNAPLAGLTVELLDSSGTSLSTPVITTTSVDGSYTFSTPTLGSFKVKAQTSHDESEMITVSVTGASGISGQNVFLKGKGGDIRLQIKDADSSGVKTIPVTLSVSGYPSMHLATDLSGYINIQNTLMNVSYTAKVLPSDIVDDMTNTKKYALWDATLANSNNQYIDEIVFAMLGNDQSGSFNVRERNDWGADGIVAVDQDDDGSYSAASDTGASGMKVEVYYSGTTTKVLGSSTITTGDDGKYNFKYLPLGNYDVAVTNISNPYLPVTPASGSFTVTSTTGNPTAINFLVKVDPNDTTLASISGYVFALASDQFPQLGPDSGNTGNTRPATASTRFATTVNLYQYDGTNWKLYSTQTSKSANGAYGFRGLTKGKDYKVEITESGINTAQYVFVGDTDGKSTSTSSSSLSSHKGKVTLSNGNQANIAPREIIITGLNSTKIDQNFWYSGIGISKLYVTDYMYNADNNINWGGNRNGLTGSTAAAYMKGTFYEEDGITPATKLDSTPLIASYLSGPDGYGYIGRIDSASDHGGIYYFKLDEYDSDYLTIASANYFVRSALNGTYSSNSGSGNITFRGKTPNNVSGYVYLNKSHPGTTGSYDPNIDSPINAIRVSLARKQVSTGVWQGITTYATNTNGAYNFTNLPDGEYRITVSNQFGSISNVTADDVTFENNDQNVTAQTSAANSYLYVNLSGGQTINNDTNFWLKLKQNDYVIRGTVYLDTRYSDKVIQQGQPNNENDLTLFDATVLLCSQGDSSDCTIGGANYLSHKTTTVNGKYEFTGTTDGITAGVNYMVKVLRTGTTPVTNSAKDLFPTYIVNFTEIDVPVTKNFLMQGKGVFSGHPVNDFNGDRAYAGAGTAENGGGRFKFYYWDGSTYQYWGAAGHYYNNFELRSLPEGKYKLVHDVNLSGYLDIADSDPSSNAGTIEFEVLSDGAIADGLGSYNRFYFQAGVLNVTEAVSGHIYLDVSGNGIKDDKSIALTSSELNSGISVEGFFTPRLYPNYFIAGTENIILADPDFIDSNVSTNGRFSYTAANSTRGDKLYMTNALLQLKGLDTSKFELVANSSQSKGSYLPSLVTNSLDFIQVTSTSGGAPDQYWLVKLKNNTKISGQLFYDINDDANYIPADGDSPVGGVRVELWKAGSLYTYTTSNDNGEYEFSNLFDSNYDIKVTTTGVPSGYELKSAETINGISIANATAPIVSGIDFIFKKTGDASISGNVMIDINNNGVVDINFSKTGDLAVEDVTIELHKNSVSTIPYKTVKTNAKGYYSFSGIDLNANYIVKMVTPSGYGVIKNANGVATDTLSAITIGETPISASNQYFLLAGGSNSNPTAGNTSSSAINSGIAGQTLIDDGVNTAMANVLLGLIDGNGIEIARQISDSSGYYHFYNLPSDTYKINVISSPTGYAIVKNADGTTQPLDILSGITLTTSGSNSKNFWYKTASAEGIQGKVYVDFADASISTTSLDSHAHLIGNSNAVTVELYDGIGATGTKLMTTTTVNGVYQFPNLIFGTGVDYSVKIDMSNITDYAFKLSKSGSGSTNVVIDVANLPSAGSTDNHYLVKGKQKITGDVWVDVDGDLIKGTAGNLLNGVTVKLEYKAPGASAYSTLKTTTTANASSLDGQYSFTALPKGTDYKVTVDNTSAVLAGTSLIPSSGIGSIAGNTNTFETTGLSADVTGQSTAYRYNGKVSGQFIVDIDGNGARSAVDTHFAGVALTLKATINGVMITKTAITDTDGKFSIDNLPIGNWSLDVAPTASQTMTNWGSYTLSYSKNSAGTKVTGSTALPLTMAITASDPTFANLEVAYKGGAKISGYVVLDVDPTDGIHAVNGTDTPVTGLTMTLSSDTAGFVSRTVTTDSNGYYEFTDLSIHTYKVSVDSTNPQLAGHLISFDPLSTATSTSSSSSVNLVVSAANSDLTTQDFGYKSSGGLSGYIYRDISGSGTRHSAVDDKLAGVKIKATQGSVVRYSNLTTANGEYTIENLAAGLWTVEIDTLPSSDYSYSYIADTFGTTATVVTNGAEVDILPTAITRAVKGATVSFGVKANAIISGKVVIDVDDQDPLPPAAADVMAGDIAIDASGFFPTYVVSLYNGSTLLKTTKVVGGNYEFANLTNNVAYTVEVTQPSSNYINSFTLTSSSSGVTAGVPVSTTAKMSQTYTLSALSTQAQNSHFAWKGAGGVSGNVFWDKNDDGVYTNTIDSDVGSAVTVTLSHVSGSVPNITRTIASGSTAYSATGLLPGSWTVATSGVPTTFKASFDPDDVYSASSLATTANTAVITVSGSTLTNQHFGYIKGGALVGELKNDASASGLYNSGDAGVNPVEVSLLDTTNGAILDTVGNPITVNTNSHGEFSFRNLDPTMDYHVQVLFGSAALAVSPTHPLGEMDPSYDSQAGTISLIPPVSSTVDVVNETHTILAAISTAANNEITLGNLYFGYRSAGGDLTIHKKALKDNVVVGDIVPYTITIENNKATTAFNVMIKDLIPAGFKYVKGSARLDGQKIAEPTGGRPVFFGPMDIGGQGAGSAFPTKRTLTYMLVVGAGVTQGEYKNVAVAIDRSGKDASNTSQATVTVTSDPLFDNALIFGTVYVDRNGNGIQDEGEEGLAGVKLVTVRSEIITTDAFGRYHLAGVNGGRWERGTNFVLKLDPKSLPKGYKVIGRNPIVVRLSPGLPSKIDFKISEDK
ncbi:hypothetical protein GCM10023211_01680 [Orbus sasakiae]|uniref:Uncharacterized protein n=2 Tax=Orbus sasakiae TaxID=1078475 RepID=A0ABP9N4F0_9GAMM